MKLLLMSISKNWKYSNAGIDLIAGYLRNQGFQVNIYYFHHDEPLSEMMEAIDITYDVYGFSVYYNNYEKFADLTKFIKKNNSRAIVFWGGAFPSMYYKILLRDNPNLDYIILGDGEKPVEYLLNAVNNHEQRLNHDSIASIRDLENKHNFCNGQINYLPVWDYYLNDTPEHNEKKIHCVQSKNNVCTGTCSFCFERKGQIVYKDISVIIDEIKYVAENFGVKKIFLSDDNLLDPNNNTAKERIKNLCFEIKRTELKLVFTCYIKANSFSDNEADNSLLQLMSDVGFATMFIGIESGSETDLRLYNKHTTVEDNYTIVNLLRRHNIIPLVGFINFNPYSTLETLTDNYNYLVGIGSNNLYSYACSFLNLYIGTPLYNMVQKDNLLLENYGLQNDLAYAFEDPLVAEIADFVKSKLYDRIMNIYIESSWLIQRLEECIRLDPSATKYRKVLESYRLRDLAHIKDFFGDLYVKGDVDKCRMNVDHFLKYFENQVDDLKQYLYIFNDIFDKHKVG